MVRPWKALSRKLLSVCSRRENAGAASLVASLQQESESGGDDEGKIV